MMGRRRDSDAKLSLNAPRRHHFGCATIPALQAQRLRLDERRARICAWTGVTVSEQTVVPDLAAPRSASTPRRFPAALILLHSEPVSTEEALATYTTRGARVAPHYYIAADGALAHLVPEHRAVRIGGQVVWRGHRRAIGGVAIAIALEHPPGTPFAAAQLHALGALVADIAARHQLDADDVVTYVPPPPGRKSGALAHVHLPALLPKAPSAPALLSGDESPALLSAELDDMTRGRLWLALMEETFRRRGGIGFQPGWAFHLHAASQDLGAPLAPSSPEGRWISHGGRRYGYQTFARDTIFNADQQWTAVQNLSQLANGARPVAGSLALLLLQRSYADALAAGPQPIAGATELKPDQAMPQLALRERLGPSLSGGYRINVAGELFTIRVFAGDTLYTPIAAPESKTNWGDVRRLSQTPSSAVREALWFETYKVSGSSYQPGTPFHTAAEREQLGAPLTGVFRLGFEGRDLDVQIFARDTLFALPGSAPARASTLPKPPAVSAWRPTPPTSAQPTPPANNPSPPTFAPPPGDRSSAAWPPAPGFRFLATADRERMFGKYAYTVNADRSVAITDGWAEQNLVDVPTPQLARLRVASVKFHRRAAPQLQALLAAWEHAGLLDRVISWDGTFVARMMRKLDQLSAHAWGSAFDINWKQNQQGILPPLVGQPASVRELVALANHHGFFWGGHFTGAFIDGMHFELAVLR
jgi:hypothetical protein